MLFTNCHKNSIICILSKQKVYIKRKNMLMSQKRNIAEEIVNALSLGSLTTSQLQSSLSKSLVFTRQGFYKALRELLTEGVVVKNKRSVSLNNAWISKIHEFIQNIDHNYESQALELFINLKEGESLIYKFKDMESMDNFWMHYFFLLVKQTEGLVLMFVQHEWFSVMRPAEEAFVYKWLEDIKRESYLVVGHDTVLDRQSTAYIKNNSIEISYEEQSSFKSSVYVSIMGDYLLYTIISSEDAALIDKIYNKYKVVDSAMAGELTEVVNNLSKAKIIISKNKIKAEKYRKKLLNYFIFYK